MNFTLVKLTTTRQILWRCLRGYNYSFLVVAAILVVLVALVPAAHKFHLFGPKLPIAIGAAMTVALLAVRINRSQRVWRPWCTVVVFAAFLVVQLTVAWALTATGSGWDSQIVLDQAVRYAQQGSIDPALVDYFQTYPNNVALLVMLGGYFKLVRLLGVSDLVTAASVLNAVALWLSQIMLYLVARRLYGARIARMTWPLSLLLLAISPQTATVYTDTLAALFPISLWYVVLRASAARSSNTRLGWLMVMGVVAVVGVLMKPTVIMAVIAPVVALGVWLLVSPATATQQRRRWWMVASGALMTGLFCLFTYASYLKLVDTLDILPYPARNLNDVAMPAWHYAAIGMKTREHDGVPAYGVYSAEAVANISAQPGQQAKTVFALSEIQRQLAGYGPVGYADFLLKKALWILSDGTFYAYGEGNTNLTFYHNDAVSWAVRQLLYVGGWGYGGYSNVAQVCWLAVLMLVALPVARLRYAARNNFGFTTLVPRLMLTGLILFILLFEGRSRYLFLYVPVFIGLALYTLKIFEPGEPLRTDDAGRRD
jgi:hypothetical protein